MADIDVDDQQARMDAALGIRLSYGMALENLMAFLCATIGGGSRSPARGS